MYALPFSLKNAQSTHGAEDRGHGSVRRWLGWNIIKIKKGTRCYFPVTKEHMVRCRVPDRLRMHTFEVSADGEVSHVSDASKDGDDARRQFVTKARTTPLGRSPGVSISSAFNQRSQPVETSSAGRHTWTTALLSLRLFALVGRRGNHNCGPVIKPRDARYQEASTALVKKPR